MKAGTKARRRPAPRLVCDVMLGRLARWLRALGYDTAYDHTADDAALVQRAARERRILVTRDTRIAPPPAARLVLLHANDTPGQLRELLVALGSERPPRLMRRCLVCNGRLRAAATEEIESRAPDHVRTTRRDFRSCPGCGRLYWPGTHQRRLDTALAAALAGARREDHGAFGTRRRQTVHEGPGARRPGSEE